MKRFFELLAVVVVVAMIQVNPAAAISLLDCPGVTGNGTADDTAGICDCLEGNKTIEIPATANGYKITDSEQIDFSDHRVTAEPGAMFVFYGGAGSIAVKFDGAGNGFDAVDFHGIVDGLAVKLVNANTTGFYFLNTRRISAVNCTVKSNTVLTGTVGFRIHGGAVEGVDKGAANNVIRDCYSFRLDKGIVVDSSTSVVWSNRNKLEGNFLQSCNIGLVMQGDTNRIEDATQGNGVGVDLDGDSNMFNGFVSESDDVSVDIDAAASRNIISGTAPAISGSGLKTTLILTDKFKTPAISNAITLGEGGAGNITITPALTSLGDMIFYSRLGGGALVAVMSFNNSATDPYTYFYKDAYLAGAWDSGHLRIGPVHIWTYNGDVYRKNGKPNGPTDGTKF